MKMEMKLKTAAALIAMCIAGGVLAADVDKLGTELSPVGAEKGGNKDGSIPPLGAKSTPKDGWAYGKNREDYWEYSKEKPLFSIDASNVEKYADKLSPAQAVLIKQTKGYRMDIYPSHRNCGYPDFAQANAKTNAAHAKIGTDGWSLEDVALPGVPFPMPKKGIDVIWNYLALYIGVGMEMPSGWTYVSPRPGSTEPIKAGWESALYTPSGKKGTNSLEDIKGLLFGLYYSYTSPAAFAGQGLVASAYFKNDDETFYYFTGQRRVRRLPAYTYDAPVIGFENQYPVDATNLYSGTPDRFDWKLVGKKEMYIPYNNFKFNDGKIKLSDAFQDHIINPALGRYELHRVWVVEGTLKQGFRHSAPKKVMYFDEDSWIVVAGDDYDAQGKIWKYKENQNIPSWEVGACVPTVLDMYDLNNGRYVADNVVFGTGKDFHWLVEAGNNPHMKQSFFTAESLRAISER